MNLNLLVDDLKRKPLNEYRIAIEDRIKRGIYSAKTCLHDPRAKLLSDLNANWFEDLAKNLQDGKCDPKDGKYKKEEMK